MDRPARLIRIGLAAAAVMFTAACWLMPFSRDPAPKTPTPRTPTVTPKTVHFESDLLGLDYPEGMRIYSGDDPSFYYRPTNLRLGGDLVVGLAHPSWERFNILDYSIGIFRYPQVAGSLEDFIENTYRDVKILGMIDDVPTVVVDGITAQQRSYRVAIGEILYTLRDIWLEQGENIFRISFWHENRKADDSAAFKQLSDQILGGLVFKSAPEVKVKTSEPEPSRFPTP